MLEQIASICLFPTCLENLSISSKAFLSIQHTCMFVISIYNLGFQDYPIQFRAERYQRNIWLGQCMFWKRVVFLVLCRSRALLKKEGMLNPPRLLMQPSRMICAVSFWSFCGLSCHIRGNELLVYTSVRPQLCFLLMTSKWRTSCPLCFC